MLENNSNSSQAELLAGFEKRKLLVVEDNEINRELLCDLVSDNYDTYQAENGQIGIDILNEHYREISLILLDVQMPVMNGYEFLKIAKKDPLLSEIPVVVTTASEASDEEEKCLELGASDFVTKPYNPNVVLKRIASIIKLRESAAVLSAVEMDDLTGVYTKQAFFHHAKRALTVNPDKEYDVLVADIEGFRLINERQGEETGDEVLRSLGKYLRQLAGNGVISGRISGDVFACMAEKNENITMDMVTEAYEAISQSIDIPFVTLKIGIYENVEHDLPVSVICDRAKTALNTVKHKYGQKYAYYDDKMKNAEKRIHDIEMCMKDALISQQFKVYYQPKHSVKTGKLVGAEALIRWIHPQYGFMSPGEFIPLFEKSGFVVEADQFVWKKTVENQKMWQDAGLDIVPISVNQSKLDFDQEDLYEKLTGECEKNALDPEYMHIEVTETLFSDNMDELVAKLNKIREYGFAVELDDFGSGYSSLSTLTMMPLDVIKMDMSLIRGMKDPNKEKVLDTCIKLAKMLGYKTVCEGVEESWQVEKLGEMGGDAIQGYYYSKPLPQEEFESYMKKCMDGNI